MELITNVLAFAIAIYAIVKVLIRLNDDDIESGCDYDCDSCPFPKCSDEQIERWRENDLHNR